MRIGILSDTHIPVNVSSIPSVVYKYFKNCDLIIHAGDIIDEEVLDELSMIAETKAVRGNMDSMKLKKILPEILEIEVEGKKIGIAHGYGPARDVLENVKKLFKTKKDIVIYGHSHEAMNEHINGTLYFNPGSLTDVTCAPFRSLGIIEIVKGEVKAEIIKI
ncbi:MAG: metallophosphoesterase family protein [Candidatus Omnitrophica bacterium]|nr:metallophosphoesterase family protein [Candidatus Omnitrophota bacterium]